MTSFRLVLFLILIVSATSAQAYRASEPLAAVFVGQWEVIEDPDNPDSTETFQVTAEGDFIFEDGTRCGTEPMSSQMISVVCRRRNGSKARLDLRLSEDQTVLSNPSGTTYRRTAQ